MKRLQIHNFFLNAVNKLEKKYGVTINSDEGDIYLSFKTTEKSKIWDTISIGWDGDGTDLKVTEVRKNREYYVKQALLKLSDKEKNVLGLN